MFTVLFLIIIIVVIIQTELLGPEAMREAASPADVVLLKWVGVCFVGAGAGGAADASVVRVDAESGLNHHHAVMILVAAWRICGGKEKKEKLEKQSKFNSTQSFFTTSDRPADLLISAKHGCLLHSSWLSGVELGSQRSLGAMLSARHRTSRTR